MNTIRAHRLRRIRICHRYIVHDQLACDSPRILVQFLKEHIASLTLSSDLIGPLNILDVAAGNGIVGAELRQQLTDKPGIRRLIGTDLLESARSAALRDRPDVYDDYVAADLTQPHGSGLPSSSDVVTICAALGPGQGDLPLEAVDGAITLLREGGLLTLTVNAGGQRAGTSLRWQSFLASVNGRGGSHVRHFLKFSLHLPPLLLLTSSDQIRHTVILTRKRASGRVWRRWHGRLTSTGRTCRGSGSSTWRSCTEK